MMIDQIQITAATPKPSRPITPHCCWSTFAAPVKVAAGALLAGGAAALDVFVADTDAGALDDAGELAALEEAGVVAGAAAVGRLMVTPPERQNCWAKVSVAVDDGG